MAILTVPRLRPNNPFTDTEGNLTGEGYRFLDGLYLRVGGSLNALNAVTLADKTWDAPNPIGATTPSTGKFTTVQATASTTTPTLVVTTGVSQSGGIKHTRVSTGSISVGTALVTHTWAIPFADANYTVTATMQDSTTAVASLALVHIESYTASQVVLRVNNTAAAPITGTIHLIALHD